MQSPTGSRAAGFALSVGGALFFALGLIFSKELTDGDLAVPWILAIRFSIAALILIAIGASQGQLSMSRRQFIALVLLGAIGYGGEAGLFFLGLERGSATATTLIFYAYPAIVATAAVMRGRERLGAASLAALTVTSLGIVLLVLPGGGVEISLAGVIFSLGAALVFSGYLIFGEDIVSASPALAGAAVTVLGAAMFHMTISAVFGLIQAPDSGDTPNLLAVSGCTAAAFIGLVGGLRLLGALESALVFTIEPLAGAILAALFLDEVVSPLQAVGGAFVLLGVGLRAFSQPAVEPVEVLEEAAPL
jgi:drug/metabolite transporter (DMT)-like permease